MRRYMWIVAIWIMGTLLQAGSTTIIGTVMYQNQPFTKKDKHIFDTDWEGLRVWQWRKAQVYCKKFELNGYDDWQVASRDELKALFSSKRHNGLRVKKAFASQMPPLGGKYDDVWMWTRESKDSKLGGFVNFKTAKSGWADKKYKGYLLCTRKVTALLPKQKRTVCEDNARQETTYSRNWEKAWNTCSGYTALKKDGSLWQFGKVGGCGWGGILPVDPQTGEPLYKKKYRYYLQPKKIGDGFKKATFINGGYRMYAIKKDGTLWGWGEGFGAVPRKLSKSHNWSSFGIKYEGNGCNAYDVGLQKNGTLWRFPEFFDYTKKGTALKLQKISRFNDWKKIVLGCCAIYGLRKDGSLWESYEENGKTVFKKYHLQKKSYGCDMELYSFLKSKMKKVPYSTVYNPKNNEEKLKANQDGTLCLLPIEE